MKTLIVCLVMILSAGCASTPAPETEDQALGKFIQNEQTKKISELESRIKSLEEFCDLVSKASLVDHAGERVSGSAGGSNE